jgi:DNA anti-recombination protein RmuC
MNKIKYFWKKNNITKKSKKIINKYWRLTNSTFILTNEIRKLGIKLYHS